mmetsp:Transcript_38192/g.96728  ORF Transcript_38192/g.96728 Transcript_38192/m.96728 type:complete len:205 (-) Transcript_38192:1236-1850(-)
MLYFYVCGCRRAAKASLSCGKGPCAGRLLPVRQLVMEEFQKLHTASSHGQHAITGVGPEAGRGSHSLQQLACRDQQHSTGAERQIGPCQQHGRQACRSPATGRLRPWQRLALACRCSGCPHYEVHQQLAHPRTAALVIEAAACSAVTHGETGWHAAVLVIPPRLDGTQQDGNRNTQRLPGKQRVCPGMARSKHCTHYGRTQPGG